MPMTTAMKDAMIDAVYPEMASAMAYICFGTDGTAAEVTDVALGTEWTPGNYPGTPTLRTPVTWTWHASGKYLSASTEIDETESNSSGGLAEYGYTSTPTIGIDPTDSLKFRSSTSSALIKHSEVKMKVDTVFYLRVIEF